MLGNPGKRAGLTKAEVILADGEWSHVSFGLSAANLTVFSGLDSVGDILANASELRTLSAIFGPKWAADTADETLGADKITADPPPVQTVSAWGLTAVLLMIPPFRTILLLRRLAHRIGVFDFPSALRRRRLSFCSSKP